MDKIDTLILGAGPAGLATGYGLKGNCLILEKEDSIGGLCRSIKKDGGVFDIGGHSFHTPHSDVYELVNSLVDGGLEIQQRDARVYTHGSIIPYPFQKFYHNLNVPNVVDECRKGLKTRSDDFSNADNLEDYLIAKFGAGIANHFLLPYNRKIWARDIKTISCEWTAERIADSQSDSKVIENKEQRKPLQSNTKVGYPSNGGFEEIYKSFIPYINNIKLNADVVFIDVKNKLVSLRDGNKYSWKKLISTIPIPILCDAIADIPQSIKTMASTLDYMSLRVELLLTKNQLENPIQRLYSADPDIPPHKIAFNHQSSNSLRKKDCHAIMAEVSLSKDKPVDTKQIAPKTIQFLCDTGFLNSPNDISWQGHIDVKYAYPVYTHKRPQLVADIKAWLKQKNIWTIGRFGDWEYINSDRCIKKGLDLANELLNNSQ